MSSWWCHTSVVECRFRCWTCRGSPWWRSGHRSKPFGSCDFVDCHLERSPSRCWSASIPPRTAGRSFGQQFPGKAASATRSRRTQFALAESAVDSAKQIHRANPNQQIGNTSRNISFARIDRLLPSAHGAVRRTCFRPRMGTQQDTRSEYRREGIHGPAFSREVLPCPRRALLGGADDSALNLTHITHIAFIANHLGDEWTTRLYVDDGLSHVSSQDADVCGNRQR